MALDTPILMFDPYSGKIYRTTARIEIERSEKGRKGTPQGGTHDERNGSAGNYCKRA